MNPREIFAEERKSNYLLLTKSRFSWIGVFVGTTDISTRWKVPWGWGRTENSNNGLFDYSSNNGFVIDFLTLVLSDVIFFTYRLILNIRDMNNINFEDLNILVKFLKRKYIRRMSFLDGLSK